MVTTTEELSLLGHQLLPDFMGVYSRDEAPQYFNNRVKNGCFIMNTDTSNLPGQHWIACIVRHGEGYVFDPLGFAVPLTMVEWLTDNTYRWTCNTREIQPYSSHLCGYYCLHFLYHATSIFFNEEEYSTILNIIYPCDFTQAYYETCVLNFINAMKKHYTM